MDTELKTDRLQLVVEPSLLDRIDDYRFGSRIGSRSDAVRKLVLKGLEAEAKERAAA